MSISRVSHLTAIGALLTLGAGLVRQPVRAADALKAGDPFPDLGQFQLEGAMPESWKGKVVLLDFWASWCGPCKASFPVMEELYQKYGKGDFVIVAVNLDDKRALMEVFLKDHPVSFPVVRDATRKLVGVVNISSMPASFLLDREGRIVSVHRGFRGEETKKEYVREIEALLKPKPAKD
jgi:thiol-disulfide isomerase/thioredoxin